MSLKNAIYECYGVRIPPTPADGVQRRFKIDQLRNGFLIRVPDFSCFGSIIDGERYIFSDFGLMFSTVEHKDNKEIQAEWMVWRCAKGLIERGDFLNREDSERLKVCVDRLESWL